ncbi:MAG: DUF5721 family protein [Lachnospiraceae bacterium]|nr:DUF5721 family protein [Lachnospiraceae bacterium]
MTAFRINDIKKFMELLLSGEAFDDFMFIEAELDMAMDYKISGRINRGFYSTDENEILGTAAFHMWAAAKENVRRIITGRRLPVRMKIVLQKDDEDASRIINVRYDRTGLVVITGFAQKGFNPDKQPERDWDNDALVFLKKLGLETETC